MENLLIDDCSVTFKPVTRYHLTPIQNILVEISEEIDNAVNKFPTFPNDALHALAIISEEHGELCKAVLQHTYEPHKATIDDIRMEAIQTAAMCIRFLLSLDELTFDESQSHKQNI